MISLRSRIARILLSGLIAAFATTPSISRANGFGFCHPHGFGFGLPVAGTSFATNVGTSSVLMPMGLTTPLVNANVGISSGASLPMSLTPAGLTTNVLTTASVPIYYTAAGSVPAPAGIAPAGIAPAGVAPAGTGTDILAEYNAFVVGENATVSAGGSLSPSSLTTQFGSTSLGLLSSAVGGANRLGSIERFLRTKINDPNFRAKAFDLFGRFLGAGLPQLQPLIDILLGQLGQGAGGGVTPVHPVGGGTPSLPVNANGELRVRVTFDNAPPPTGRRRICLSTQTASPTRTRRVRLRSSLGSSRGCAGPTSRGRQHPCPRPRRRRRPPRVRLRSSLGSSRGFAGPTSRGRQHPCPRPRRRRRPPRRRRRPPRRGKNSPSSSSQFQQSSLVTVFLFRSAELLGGTASARSPCPP